MIQFQYHTPIRFSREGNVLRSSGFFRRHFMHFPNLRSHFLHIPILRRHFLHFPNLKSPNSDRSMFRILRHHQGNGIFLISDRHYGYVCMKYKSWGESIGCTAPSDPIVINNTFQLLLLSPSFLYCSKHQRNDSDSSHTTSHNNSKNSSSSNHILPSSCWHFKPPRNGPRVFIVYTTITIALLIIILIPCPSLFGHWLGHIGVSYFYIAGRSERW